MQDEKRWLRSDEPVRQAWQTARAAFIPKDKSDEMAKLRTIVPGTLVCRRGIPSLSTTRGARTQVEVHGRLREGGIRGCALGHDANSHGECRAERSGVGLESRHQRRVGVDRLRHVVEGLRREPKRIGVQGALDTLRTVTGHTRHPNWMNIQGRGVRIHRGCKQVAPDSPILWNLVSDEALARHQGAAPTQVGVRLPAYGTDARGKRPESFADGSEFVDHSALADDILLIRTSAEEIRILYNTCRRHARDSGEVGQRNMNPDACIDLGTLLCGGRNALVRHRTIEAWGKFWMLKPALTTGALSLQTRLRRFGAEVFPSSLGVVQRGT